MLRPKKVSLYIESLPNNLLYCTNTQCHKNLLITYRENTLKCLLIHVSFSSIDFSVTFSLIVRVGPLTAYR